MTHVARITALSLASLLGALGAGCTSATDSAAPDVGASAQAIVPPLKCPPGTFADCSNDLGPGGNIIRSCICVSSAPPPPTTPGVQSLAVGTDDNGCLLLTDGTVRCWGGFQMVQPALTTVAPTYALTPIALPASATAIAAGGNFSDNVSQTPRQFACALLPDRAVWCWGDDDRGELGNGMTQASATPVQVIELTSQGVVTPLLASKIAARGSTGCAVTTQGGIACWGDNQFGQIGNPIVPQGVLASSFSAFAIPVTLPATASAVTVGRFNACALLADGRGFCWGDNAKGWLGVGSSDHSVLSPQPLLGLTGPLTAIRAGEQQICAEASGVVSCWSYSTPITQPYVAGPASAFSVAMDAACKIANGALVCWGYAASGYYPPIATTTDLTDVELGGMSLCILTSYGHVECTNAYNPSPVIVY